MYCDGDKINPNLYSPLALAFIGDGVYELLVRERIIRMGNMPASKMHLLAVSQVRAEAQAYGFDVVAPILEQQELSILKRGRNAHSSRVPKNADVVQYRKATGLEALFGYLYISEKKERITELFDYISAAVENEHENRKE